MNYNLRMGKLWQWCKEHFFGIGTLFFLFFIPLYPKLPLVNVIRSWVYIRIEDVLIAVFIGIYALYVLWRRKVPNTPLTVPIVTYWLIGIAVVINAVVFIEPQLRGHNFYSHIVVLHFVRRIEYMALFFIAFHAIITKQIKLSWVISTLVVTLVSIFVYGVGQKFLGFPAFLTMNEEFAKGVPLRLPPTARISSTFGGHYDLAAYLVLLIPVFGSLVFGIKSVLGKIGLTLVAVLSLALLLLTASRISFGVYLVAITTMLVWQKKKILVIPVIIASFFMLNLVSGTADRFYKTFRYSDVVVDLSTGRPIGTLDKLEGTSAVIRESESPAEESLPTGSGFINVPKGGEQGDRVGSIVYQSQDLTRGSGDAATISGSFLVQKALVYDISITTRFQGQWPKAIEAFKRNILLGSGFSSLSVAADGDYHRMLGETGLIGAIAFLGILALSFYYFLKNKDAMTPLARSFVIGIFAGIVGLLCNAILIDVFEASKVAYTLWLLLGLAMGVLYLHNPAVPSYFPLLKRLFIHKFAFYVYLILFVLLYYGWTTSVYFLGDDFTWLKWSAESTPADIVRYFTDAQGFFYRPIPKLFYFLQFSVFWLKPAAYHITTLVLFATTIVILYRWLLHFGVRRGVSWGTTLLFAMLAIHHENIVWISTQSHMLSFFFLIISLHLFGLVWTKKGRFALLQVVGANLTLALSMLSYDPMLVAPAVVLVVGLFVYRVRLRNILAILAYIPAYLALRNYAGAVPMSGDYGVNPEKLLINAAANTLTYLGAIFGSTPVILYAEKLRAILREQVVMMSIAAAGVIGVLIVFVSRYRRLLHQSMPIAGWLAAALISLVPFVGLGGVAERYTLWSSFFLFIALGIVAEHIWARKGMAGKAIIIAIWTVLLVWNYQEGGQRKLEWQFAGNVSQDALLKFRKEFYPPVIPKNYVFVDIPIRYGRAWIFPTGFDDAIWHTMRLSEYYFITAPTVEDAFLYKSPTGVKTNEVLLFEDYVLKRVVKQIQ